MRPQKADRVDPRSKENGINTDPRRPYNDQIDVCLMLKDKLDRAKEYYFQIQSDYDNACYMARMMDATLSQGNVAQDDSLTKMYRL